jgi:hypothetical protein
LLLRANGRDRPSCILSERCGTAHLEVAILGGVGRRLSGSTWSAEKVPNARFVIVALGRMANELDGVVEVEGDKLADSA